MAVDKLVDSTQLDADLTDVADEIRTAGGTLLPLSFPDDYVVAIGDIGNTEIKTVSGSIAHFEDALARKAQDLTVAIEPVQDLHGQENPWPAGGGKNKFPALSGTSNGITYTLNQNGTVNVNGTSTAYSAVASDYVLFPAGSYKLTGASGEVSLQVLNRNGTILAQNNSQYPVAGLNLSEDTEIRFRISVPGASITVSNVTVSPMLQDASITDPTFAPYSNICPISGWTGANIHVSPTTVAADGTTYSITFPTEAGTVYGGTLDVTTGKLTVTHWGFDLGSVDYTQSATLASRFAAFFPTGKNMQKLADQNRPSGNIISSKYNEGSYTSVWSNGQTGICVYLAGNIMKFGICDPSYTDAETFKQSLTGQTIVYKLATPIVYNLTPTEVTTLLGTNNVWGDTGDSTIKYIAPKAQIPSAQGVYF